MERYQFIYNQLVSGKYSDADVINQLTNKKFYGLSLRQAYDDMKAAKSLFSSFIKINKRYELHLALQLNPKRQIKAELNHLSTCPKSYFISKCTYSSNVILKKQTKLN